MSDSLSPGGLSAIKTLAARLNEERRAQLDIIAQLNDRTVTEEIRLANDAWIAKSKSGPAIKQRAAAVRAEIEREAATKRSAIEAIFEVPTSAARSTPRQDGLGGASVFMP
ncbi:MULTISPECIES: hypothetical protein [unclassified Frondihabitans]|uniref:hypothetical protein n=1 Tax=unclassified Frondihabitans TaxID=2626248 RepID=UPI000F4F57B6|nr:MULTISPECIES: hypothetical protein [unclassified Frondihabitans]RPE76007.1 hypothetical protein EDF37_1824 [Frondihabitans sp. PhB153]RPF05716.1 hypothetical protein EDF39_2424 [Frondihabitans sp. PhB161]